MAEGMTKPICGLVMPISSIDGCSEAHWAEVQEIISDAITAAGFEPSLVSSADDVGIIQKRIIQNLYDNPVVVVDVSAKNANVMFELGLRLAFDKPTIIVKDDKTAYSFDTAPIEHLGYPRDLRFSQIVEFKEKLATKIIGTHKAATTDKNYTTFLKHFGEFTVAKLDKKEVTTQEFLLAEMRELRLSIERIERRSEEATTKKEKMPRSLHIDSNGVPTRRVIDYIMSNPTLTSMLIQVGPDDDGSGINIRFDPNVGPVDRRHVADDIRSYILALKELGSPVSGGERK